LKARDKDIKKRKHLTPGRRYKTYIESITGGDIKAMEGPMIAEQMDMHSVEGLSLLSLVT